MNSQGELAKCLGGLVVQIGAFQVFPGSPESEAEREMFLLVAQCAQQTPHLVGPFVGGENDAQGRSGLGAACVDAFEEKAFEVAAVAGTIGIDAASAAVEGWARLV